ncbi:DNA phosphorothioation-dependent restriction protein DptH [Photobacterium gaetbulicola]|uniref:Dnd system-associated protein 2 n=1 Tax=Photobacterium gaetbulicola Gung47 TaxID=658445 RepID=A0A0C5WTU1_9GAMM|nr:DNA phosphorothioation-dependent restriction protein DptH [Photobacterium gaetbulicola]AJR09782.1 dnd system-associated protein 2 [Photobacterium gaetbulicola Gung47]PSU12300.1 DNA phosphorothioation-dependent restriction protein DptH [Photobacterium gaetbulicola]
MSVEQFDNFLAEQILSGTGTEIEVGGRYQFRCHDYSLRLRLFDALERLQSTKTVINGHEYPKIKINSCYVIPLLHADDAESQKGAHEHYLAKLRDEVVEQTEGLEGCALLYIHDSSLDTIVNSSKSLQEPGEVWSLPQIKDIFIGLIDEQDKGKDVSKCLLDDQFNSLVENGTTIFGFEPLYRAVEDGDLRFNELGMFEDPLVAEMSGNSKQIKKRLEENRALYQALSFEVEHFSDQLHDRLKSFGEKFIREHFTETDAWKDVEYESFVQEKKNNAQQRLILEEELASEGMTITGRNRAETKAGMRDRHLIIELDEGVDEFELKVIFQGASNLDKREFKVQPPKALNKQEVISTRNGLKTASASLTGQYHNEPLFFNLALKRENKSEAYNFRCLVIRKGEFYIEPFKNIFLVEHSKQRLTLNMKENKLPVRDEEGAIFTLTDAQQEVDIIEYALVDFEALANEADEINFAVKSGDNLLKFNVEGAVATDSLSLPLLLNRSRYHKLFKDDYNGELYSQKAKVGIDNSEFTVPALRLKLLRWEELFVNEKVIAISDDSYQPLDDLQAIDVGIFSSYLELFDYLEQRRSTLSLASWGDELTEIVANVVDTYLNYVEAIPTGGMLTKEQKLALRIGIVTSEQDVYYSPFHPLNLAYYLHLRNAMCREGSFAHLPDVTFERLSPKGLLPYVHHPEHEFAYNQQVKENAFWIKSVPQEKSTLSFVRKLVKEKIDEFQTAFSQLFTGSEKSIIVNAVNQDEANELFLGLVDYIRSNLEQSTSIHINLYDETLAFNAFDHFAETANYDDLKKWLELDKGKAREVADTIIDILRTRLTYSKFTNNQAKKNGQAYSHICFFRNASKVKCESVSIDSVESGIACDGFLPGEAAYRDQDSFITGFGLKNVDYSNNQKLRLAKAIGTLGQCASQETTYETSKALALSITSEFKDSLKLAYDSSIWTTIIEPRVTLDFFHSNEDVVLIHYSDQYTSSSSYDAITVTAQRSLFEKVIEKGDGGQINEFNAFNGDWLLNMMTCEPKINKERRGIIGAYKFVTSLVHGSDVTWVPLSIAEMIRVSGNVGLKMSDSDFSRNANGYKKGAISDDILLVGFKDQQMYLLPVEVKTGATPDYKKAVEQAKELLRYLSEDILGEDTLASKLNRSLFMRQVLMQVDKYRLYNVFSTDYFDALLCEKEVWLKGDYTLAKIAEYPDGFVVSHLEGASCLAPDYRMRSGILQVELPMALLPNLVKTPLQELIYKLDIVSIYHVPTQFVLHGDTSSADLAFEQLDPEESCGEKIISDLEQGRDLVIKAEKESENCQLKSVANEETVLESAKQESKATIEGAEQRVDAVIQPQESGNNLNVLFGHNALTQAPLNWEPTNTAKFMNTNTGIIGTMGTGKTQFTKSVITQLNRNQVDNVSSAPIGMLIFDYKEDYVDESFLNENKAKRVTLDRLPFNPLSLVGDKPKLPVHTASSFANTMAKAFRLGPKQQMKLKNLVIDAYEAKGIDRSDSSTWSIPAPTISDVWDIFLAQDKIDEDLLYVALDSLVSYEIFEPDASKVQSLFDLLNGVTVVELKGNDESVQNLVVALTLDLFYSQMQKKGKPEVQGDFRQITKMVLVDEADNFMSQNFPSLRKILKEGREYGVGVILSTQDITHFQTGENDYSSYVLTWVIHRVAKIRPQELKAMFGVNEKAEQEKLMETINKLDKHYSLYIDGAKKIVKMRDRAFWELERNIS